MRSLKMTRWLSLVCCLLAAGLLAAGLYLPIQAEASEGFAASRDSTAIAEGFTASRDGTAIANGFTASRDTITTTNGFRVDNRLFLDNQKEPASQSTTIFQNNAVYDYLDRPTEVFVYDKDEDSFVLLNTTRRMYTEMRRQQVLQFAEQMRQRTAEQPDPFVKFLGNPSFTTEFDQQTSVLTLNSSWMTYRVSAVQGPTPGSAERYREFTDWYARLAPMVSVAARPPFARLMLDAALVEHGLVPREIQLTMTPKQGFWPKRILIRSEHQWTNRLDTSDLVRVTQTRQFMNIFSSVSLDQYIKSVD